MPTSSVSALNSWGAYLIASAALVGVLSPQLVGVSHDSREGVDWRNADGIRAVIDALRPGTTSTLTFGTGPAEDPALLEGRQITISAGSSIIRLPTIWNLPNVTLSPATNYRISLAGSEVEVDYTGRS